MIIGKFMNKEEKEAIFNLNRFTKGDDISVVNVKDIKIVIKLIEKQQKEIEELKSKNSYHKTIAERFLHKGE